MDSFADIINFASFIDKYPRSTEDIIPLMIVQIQGKELNFTSFDLSQ